MPAPRQSRWPQISPELAAELRGRKCDPDDEFWVLVSVQDHGFAALREDNERREKLLQELHGADLPARLQRLRVALWSSVFLLVVAIAAAGDLIADRLEEVAAGQLAMAAKQRAVAEQLAGLRHDAGWLAGYQYDFGPAGLVVRLTGRSGNWKNKPGKWSLVWRSGDPDPQPEETK